MKKSKKQFPDEIYITIDNPGTPDECLLAWRSAEDFAEVGQVKKAARYALQYTEKVTAKVVSK